MATADKHPDRAAALRALVETTAATRRCLVHGDVSPKNILVGPEGPVFLDAECAWYGDPAFDLAFCLNHLLLKCLWTPRAAAGFLACFDVLAASYLAGVAWERPAALERRTARLLPGLFLGRVDGKSPVEYLTEERDKDRVRRVARALLAEPVDRLGDVRAAWAAELALVNRTEIAHVHGRRVWDSRGRPTVEAEVRLAGGARRPRDRAGRRFDRHRAKRGTGATAARRLAATTCARRSRP